MSLPPATMNPNDKSQNHDEEWEDLLGTGTIMKRILHEGHDEEIDPEEEIQQLEAPRKFFALVDVSVRCNNRTLVSECRRNFLISCESDIFAGVHLAIPLMKVAEKSQYRMHPKFCYGSVGCKSADVPPNAHIDLVIKLIFRIPFDEFLERITTTERIHICRRKKERGKFWWDNGNVYMATNLYSSIVEIARATEVDELETNLED